MEIKVRVWDTYENRMVYNAQNTYDYGCTGVPIWEDSFQDVNEDDNYIKMLYIGLKDKDGEDIYEGDIIETTIIDKFDDIDKSIGVVMYDEDDFSWLIRELDDSYWYLNEYPSSEGKKILKRIGNVYENTELLK